MVKGGPPSAVLDPSSNKTYDLIRGIIEDLNATFPDSYIHLGGDEVRDSCFVYSPTIEQFKIDHNFTTNSEIIAWHMNETRNIIREVNN